MTTQEKVPERKRRDWIIILIILLIGFLCVILAGGWAIRFSPTWKLDTNMQSNIDPNSVFLTSRPSGFLEPLDPSILTQPAWINLFLTPGASFPTNAPVTSLPTNTPLATNTTFPTAIIPPTNTAVGPSPTNTLIFIPPPTNTPKPPLPRVDLQITKTDGVTTYIDSGSTTYTIVVTNAGPNAVNGVRVTDNLPAQIASANWTCVPSGGATCTANGSGNINQSVNLPVGSTVTYTVAATIGSGVSGNMVNTATVSPPAGYTDPNTGNNSATDTNTLGVTTDLQITKTDNHTAYLPNAVKTYVIVVSNAGPSDVTGATVTDTFTTNTNIASTTWTCTPSGSATCTANGSGDINDSIYLPSGASVTYTVTATVVNVPSGDLVNTATVTEPVGIIDPVQGNNSATDIDTLIVSPGTSSGNIGPTPDDNTTVIPEGGSPVILTLSSPVTVTTGEADGFDLIYYELPNGTGIAMDQVLIEISDGNNWYQVFYWGNGSADTNSNLDISGSIGGSENDNRDFSTIPNSDVLYPFNSGTLIDPATGVTIELEGYVPDGTYLYVRLTAPSGGDGDGTEVDAIYVVP